MSDFESYLKAVPHKRSKRLSLIRDQIINSSEIVKETFRYNMPTFEVGDNWVCIANQKNYISIYFCNEGLIHNIKNKHPHLSYGKGCVRVKDNQNIPITELKNSFIKAMKLKKADK